MEKVHIYQHPCGYWSKINLLWVSSYYPRQTELDTHVAPVFLLVANFRQILTWKTWFQPIQRIFHGKKWPKCTRVFLSVPVRSHEYRRILLFFVLSYLVHSQIWLHYKILKRNPVLFCRNLWQILREFKGCCLGLEVMKTLYLA